MCCYIDQSERPVNFTRFLFGQPSNSDGEDCVSLSYISQWAWTTRKCTGNLPFVCQKGSLSARSACLIRQLSSEPTLVVPVVKYGCFVVYFTVEQRNITECPDVPTNPSPQPGAGKLVQIHYCQSSSLSGMCMPPSLLVFTCVSYAEARLSSYRLTSVRLSVCPSVFGFYDLNYGKTVEDRWVHAARL